MMKSQQIFRADQSASDKPNEKTGIGRLLPEKAFERVTLPCLVQLRVCRQYELKDRSSGGVRGDRQASAMRFDDGAADRQTYT
jgi:hypothetical protein